MLSYKIVKFSDGSYGIRRHFSLFNNWFFSKALDKVPHFLRSYVDLRDRNFTWGYYSEFFYCCRVSDRSTAEHIKSSLEKPKTHKKSVKEVSE